MTPDYIKCLTRQERASAIKFGAALAFCRHGIPLSKVDDMSKKAVTAPSGGGVLDGVSKAILATAVITGVPVGIAAHMIGRQLSTNRRKEREQLARIKYYRDATRQLESGLTGVPESEVEQ